MLTHLFRLFEDVVSRDDPLLSLEICNRSYQTFFSLTQTSLKNNLKCSALANLFSLVCSELSLEPS
jgi:hypothetical protein